jgi:hypothetical protein
LNLGTNAKLAHSQPIDWHAATILQSSINQLNSGQMPKKDGQFGQDVEAIHDS